MTKSQKGILAGIVVVLALILALVSGLYFRSNGQATKQPAPKLGSQIQNEQFWFNNGIQNGTNGITTNYGPILTIGTAKDQVSWLNNTGKTVYVSTEGTRIITIPAASSTAVASTSMYVWVGTSTTATVSDTVTPTWGTVLDSVLIATSSPLGTVHNGINASSFFGSNEAGVVAVKNGVYLVTVMEPVNAAPIGESATSTARGFNLQEVFSYWNL